MTRPSHQPVKKRLLTAGLSAAKDVLTLLVNCSGSHQLNPGLALNRSARDWNTQAATLTCSAAVIFSTAAVTAGS
jgi:hypothetical protein